MATSAVLALFAAGSPWIAKRAVDSALESHGIVASETSVGLFPPRVFAVSAKLKTRMADVSLSNVEADALSALAGRLELKAGGGEVSTGGGDFRLTGVPFSLAIASMRGSANGMELSGPAKATGDGSGAVDFSWSTGHGNMIGKLDATSLQARFEGRGWEGAVQTDGSGGLAFSAKSEVVGFSGKGKLEKDGSAVFSGEGTGSAKGFQAVGRLSGGKLSADVKIAAAGTRRIAETLFLAGMAAKALPGSHVRMSAGAYGREGDPVDATLEASVRSGQGSLSYDASLASKEGKLELSYGTRKGGNGDEWAASVKGLAPARLASWAISPGIASGTLWFDAGLSFSGGAFSGRGRAVASEIVFGGAAATAGGLAGWLSGKGASVSKVTCASAEIRPSANGRHDGMVAVFQTPLFDAVGTGTLDFLADAVNVSFYAEPNVWPDPGIAASIGGARVTGKMSSPSIGVDGDGLAKAAGAAAAAWATSGLSGLFPKERVLPRELCKEAMAGWVFDPKSPDKAKVSIGEAARGAKETLGKIRDALGRGSH